MPELETELIRGHYTGEIIPIAEAVNAGSIVPNVKAIRLDCSGFHAAKKLSRIAFDEMNTNCNTCMYLHRIKQQKCHTGIMSGQCNLKDGEFIRFHPDDYMGKACWRGRVKIAS